MSLYINRIGGNGDLILTSGELDEVNYSKIGANLTVTTAPEFDEVSISSVVEGVVKKEYASGTVAFAGSINEADYFDEALFNVPGTYNWTCPAGVTSVSVVCVGGGGSGGLPGFSSTALPTGGGGGGLGYNNNITVTPGVTYTVVVGAGGAGVSSSFIGLYGETGGDSYFINDTVVCGRGGGRGGDAAPVGGSFVGDGGGTGGAGGTDASVTNEAKGGGGGGAAGYASAGGAGGQGNGDATTAVNNATVSLSGGGAGGAAEYGTFNSNGNASGAGGGGGGVDVFGQGASGARFINVNWDQNAPGGSGGSGGTAGGAGDTGFAYANKSGAGGSYGGGSGAAVGIGQSFSPTITVGKGGDGAVRIIWSYLNTTRSFPSFNVGRSTGFRSAETFTLIVNVPVLLYAPDWNVQLVQRIQFAWPSAFDLQQFFQLGSYISLLPTQAGTPVTTKDTAWANLIDSIGNTFYTYDHYTTGGNVVVTERYSGGSYTANYYKVWGEVFEANNSIVISTLFDDASLGTTFDTAVTISVSNTVSHYRSQTPITATSPTVTIIKSLSPP